MNNDYATNCLPWNQEIEIKHLEASDRLPFSAAHPIGKSLWELWKSQKSGEDESGVS
jgi:hypothetical protein